MVVVLILILFSSCVISINSSGYSMLSTQEKNKIISGFPEKDSINTEGYIFMVTAQELKQHLIKHKKAIIYEYAPYCKADACISPDYLQRQCHEKGIWLYVVATSFDGLFPQISNISFPMLFVNYQSYGTNNSSKYTRLFFDELTSVNLTKRGYGRFHCFHQDRYIATFDVINRCDTVIKGEER